MELEAEKTGKSAFDIQHRAYAVSAVLSAVVFLEALVNETFQDAADGHASRIAPLDQRYIALMGEFWNASEMGGRYVSILDKYQMALLSLTGGGWILALHLTRMRSYSSVSATVSCTSGRHSRRLGRRPRKKRSLRASSRRTP